jgi:hypothetical protein
MSSISRDIDFMRNRLGAPIEYDALRRGYYYTERTFRLPGSFTTAENIQALGMAKTLLTLYRDTPLYTAARNLLESITAPTQNPLAGLINKAPICMKTVSWYRRWPLPLWTRRFGMSLPRGLKKTRSLRLTTGEPGTMILYRGGYGLTSFF